MHIYLFGLTASLFLAGCTDQNTQVDAIDQTFEQVRYLKVYGGFCTVEIEGSDTDQLSVTGEVRGNTKPGSYMLQSKLDDDGTLKIWVKEPVARIGTASGNLRLKVGKQTEIKVVNESGDVYVRDMIGEKVRVKTSSGDIVATDINTYMRIKTLEGDIRVANHQGDLKTKSTSGDHQLVDVEGNILSISSSGDINYTNTVGSLQAESTSGDISGIGVKLTSHSDFTSNSGSVKVRFENKQSDFTCQLKTVTGRLEVGDSLARKTYEHGKGKIILSGRTNGGNQSYKGKITE